MTKSMQFLSGGGEMGALIRAYNWESSPIGDADKWPQSLRTTLSILVNSKFPMFLYWGPQLLCFYNDAYRHSLGNDGRHPAVLGMKGEEAWPETWHRIKPSFDQVINNGESTWSEDQVIPIYRDGTMKAANWTFSFSPVKDELNLTAGVFLTLIETTEKVNSLQNLSETNDQLAFAIDATELGTFDLNPITNKFIANNRLKDWFGLPHDKEVDLLLATDVIVEKDRSHVIDAIQKALQYQSGGRYDIEYSIINPVTKEERVVRAKGRAWFGEDKTAYRFNGTLQDITEQRLASKQVEASEQRFSNILEQSIMAVSIFKGREMRISFMNEPMIQMFGKGKDVIGKTLIEVLPEIKDQPFPKLLDDVYTTGVPYYGYEMPGTLVRNGKAEETYFNFVYQPYRELDNSITGITVIGTEVGVQVHAKKLIEESENQFRTFADSIQNLAWIANGDGWIYWYNQRWYDYTGTTLEEMEGWGWGKLHHPDYARKIIDFLKEAWKKDEAFELTFPLRRHDGEYRWFLTRAYPVKDIYGKIERWIGTNTDINDQKTAEQKKDEFISIASHEMKTPLTTAKGYIELLLLSLSEENETTLYATKASLAVERLNNLVTDLLDSSKVQNGQLDYTNTTFDFNKLVEETLENFQLSAKNHRLQKVGNCLQQINADRDRVQQVLINLLSNAVKYSPKADKVLIILEEQHGTIQVSIHDFGVGMSAKHLDKIFDRYYRVEEHAVHFQGLGIGLYISKNIIERHGGKMWAESEPEKGSIFYFTLPI
jgi:PAS domain S-box-containing protein